MRSIVLVIAFGALVSTRVGAAPVTFSTEPNQEITLTGGESAKWTVRNNLGTNDGSPTGVCGDSPGLGVIDAELTVGNTTKTDAFDRAFLLWIDDHRFVAPDTVDVTDRTLTAGPVTVADVEVTVEYRAFPSSATLRTFVTLHNPSTQPLQPFITLSTNFGSDSGTLLAATSPEGNKQNWRLTTDSLTTPDDPPIVLVSFGPRGPGGLAPPLTLNSTEIFGCPGTADGGGRALRGRITIAPGQTAHLLQVVRLFDSIDPALSGGQAFNTNPAPDSELMTGITAAQLPFIVNWNFIGQATLTGGGAEWLVNDNSGTANGQPTGSNCSSTVPGFGVDDGQLSADLGDAFDTAHILFLDGVRLPPAAPFAHDDQSATIGPVVLSGLNVTQTFTALQDSPTLRTLVRVQNPGTTTVQTTLVLASNLGSDDDTVIESTSDGNTTVTDADRWLVSSDRDRDTPQDVIVTQVVAGPAPVTTTPALSTLAFMCSDEAAPNGLVSTYTLSIGPGETQTLLLFDQLHATAATATAINDALSTFDTTPGLANPLLAN